MQPKNAGRILGDCLGDPWANFWVGGLGGLIFRIAQRAQSKKRPTPTQTPRGYLL
ncbi:MAG: hypothetical protein AAGE59_32080 [Cyanobacteria bacterium P01_F01_bin.86]